ncbi:hypothetical protein AJ80_00175 [Polytolypa hystricis UAMH7299]|uniref:Enoyl reductase (ER) domain-containing protein n=1 Tax=Polytolypa hystricis (strain UAMH7299) TaxID=1447883 RepID=A0A2B7YW21_POLH7|nr:hypothetical protein AJ80_00175 [Polytolypa hystricis UAMH7299]
MDTAPGSKPSKALVLHGAKDLRLETRITPPPSASSVQIRILATGLCGSDLHYYTSGANGSFALRSPMSLGHESIGLITAIGSDVTSLSINDRVALEVGLPCQTCALCLSGRYNICPQLRFRSSAKTFPHLDGTLVELMNHPAALCHKLPASVGDEAGALLEPLAVCLHAIRRSRPPSAADVQRSNSTGAETAALIFGAGAIGLLLASALAATTPFTTIVIADIAAARLEIAASLPFSVVKTHLLLTPSSPQQQQQQPSTPEAQAEAENATASALATSLLSTFTLPQGFSHIYDCTGAPSCIRAAIHASSPGGVITQIGMGSRDPYPRMPLSLAALREVDLIGVFRYDGAAYPAAVELLGSGRLDDVAGKVVTHRVKGLEEAKRAFEIAGKGRDEEGKTVVKVVVFNQG